jgi:hypothetical protein
MYGDDGYKLALEAKRTTVDRLPVFNRELVQAVCRETRYLSESLERRLQEHQARVSAAQQQATTSASTDEVTTPPNTQHSEQELPDSMTQEENSASMPNDSLEPASSGYTFSSAPPTQSTIPPTEHHSQPTTPRSRQPVNSHVPPTLTDAQRFEMLVEHLVIQRNKRCLLGYLHRRLGVIMEDTWSRGGILPTAQSTTRGHYMPGGTWDESVLSTGEADFRRNYARLIRRHAAVYADIGLLDELRPPKELYVQVRAVRDGGLVQTEGGGTIRLEPGTQYLITRQEAQRLIGLGLVRRVD